MNRLRKIRILITTLFLIGLTLLFLDFTGTLHEWLGWMAKVQFFPALLAVNVGVVLLLILLTLLFGRIYCSSICPLGGLQDVVARLNRRKNRFHYSSELRWLRYGMLGLFIISFIAGVGSVVALIEPYSSYGRIASTLLATPYQWVNNIVAYLSERANSYAFYNIDVWIEGVGTLLVASITLLVIFILSWRGGRTYCNTICPVGTVIGFLSQFSLYKHRIDVESCNGCGLCARKCKASCIDHQNHSIDYSRCVSCFDCIDSCKRGAIGYQKITREEGKLQSHNRSVSKQQVDSARRQMLIFSAALAATSIVQAQQKKVDGGLAFIEDKKIPKRQIPIIPPGGHSIHNFTRRCTGCQLCVSACPNQVLRPSTGLSTFMQPEVSYERGYCRAECVKCSEVCPTGAIEQITTADKSSIQIGHAQWIEKNCVVITDGVACGNCARHCPTAAIQMVEKQVDSLDSQMIPIVNTERCIGCGACENLCPARPFSAIYVVGHAMHRVI